MELNDDKLTLEDVLTKTPEEILKKISFRKELAESENDVAFKDTMDEIKTGLYGFFQADPSRIKRGEVLRLDNKYFLDITSVLPSTGRVFFKIRDYNKVFSLSTSYLIGKDKLQDFPFKKGDLVRVGTEQYKVHGINPSSKQVTVKVGDTIRKFKIDVVVKEELN